MCIVSPQTSFPFTTSANHSNTSISKTCCQVVNSVRILTYLMHFAHSYCYFLSPKSEQATPRWAHYGSAVGAYPSFACKLLIALARSCSLHFPVVKFREILVKLKRPERKHSADGIEWSRVIAMTSLYPTPAYFHREG
jgi:hypothetical protein